MLRIIILLTFVPLLGLFVLSGPKVMAYGKSWKRRHYNESCKRFKKSWLSITKRSQEEFVANQEGLLKWIKTLSKGQKNYLLSYLWSQIEQPLEPLPEILKRLEFFVDALLSEGADVKVIERESKAKKRSVLIYPIRLKSLKLIHILLKGGVNPDKVYTFHYPCRLSEGPFLLPGPWSRTIMMEGTQCIASKLIPYLESRDKDDVEFGKRAFILLANYGAKLETYKKLNPFSYEYLPKKMKQFLEYYDRPKTLKATAAKVIVDSKLEQKNLPEDLKKYLEELDSFTGYRKE